MKLGLKSEEQPIVKTLVNKNFIGPSSIALDVEHGELKNYFESLGNAFSRGGEIRFYS